MALGFSRPAAADALNISVYRLDGWELNKAAPNAKSLKKLMRLYGFDLEEFLGYYRDHLIKGAESRVKLLKRRCA
jgi:transcriptional regulator with XRE-family HTH domain